MAFDEHGESSAAGRQIKRISSRLTWFNKRLFPMIWFGFLAFFLVTSLGAGVVRQPDGALFLIAPLVMAGFGYFLFKIFVWDLADEVWDGGDLLVVRQRANQVIVPLASCRNVSYSPWISPQRLTLTLREPSELGSEIAFMPPQRLLPFGTPEVVRDLIERIDAARRL